MKNKKATAEMHNKAKDLRRQGRTIIDISKELGYSKSSISSWVKDISITKEQKLCLVGNNRDMSRSIAFKNRRLESQKIGAKRVKEEDKDYLAGCMLYWAEGSKSTNTVCMSNSDVNMMLTFKRFLSKFFKVSDENFVVVLHYYTDICTSDEVIAYWLNALSLTKNNLRKCQINTISKSSKRKRFGKLKYGTCHLKVHNTTIVQEIYGAIQEYGGFTNTKWVDRL